MDQSEYIEELRQRSTRLKHDYKVLWTYYQMAQSLLRTLLKVRRIEDLGLEKIYNRLEDFDRQLAQAKDPIPLIRTLQDIEQYLQRAHYVLVQFDNNISPGVERRYIERLENYDPRFLIYLIQFLLSKNPMNQDDWDKVDLFLTKLALVHTDAGNYELRLDQDIFEIQKMVTKYFDLPYVTPERLREVITEIQAIAAEVRRVTSYDDLLEWGLLARIRDFKKNLQFLMLHPHVIVPFLKLNHTTKRKFAALYLQEIDRIHSSLREVSDTEERLQLTPPSGFIPPSSSSVSATPMDSLAGEDFAQMMASLSSRMEQLTNLLLKNHNSLMDKAEAKGSNKVDREDVPEIDLAQQILLADTSSLHVPNVLVDDFRQVQENLERVNWDRNLRSIAYSDEVKPYGLEPFEVEAYQMAFRIPHPNPVERVACRLIFLAALCRIRMSNLAMSILHSQQENPEQWIKNLSSTVVETVRSIMTVAENFENQLMRWSREPTLESAWQRRLNRAHRKLQRARVGLSLLHDQIEDEWGVIKSEEPEARTPMTQIVQVKLNDGLFTRVNIFTWLGWITALAMFVLLIIQLFVHT